MIFFQGIWSIFFKIDIFNSLVKGILLAYYTKRNLYIDQFQIDCNHIEKRNNVGQIYDLQKLQTIIDFLKLNVKI